VQFETFWFCIDIIFYKYKSSDLILEKMDQTKTFRTSKKLWKIVRKSSVLFALKPRCMETFRCNNKLTRFCSGLAFKLKKIVKTFQFDFKQFWNKLKRSAFVPIISRSNQNVLFLFR
jgi:hypothetical protein